MKNRLRGAACYLAGPMTDMPDLGISWRQAITPYLKEMGIVVFDPTAKRIEIGDESAPAREHLMRMRDAGDLVGVRNWIKPVRRVDLRMVDLSSFLIVRLDGTPTMGTFEEIDKATLECKPILVWLDGELNCRTVNPWLPGQIPPHYIFESMEEVLNYLGQIDRSMWHPADRRWMLFDFADMYREVL